MLIEHYILKCSQLKIKAIKSKSKNDVIEYKKQHDLVSPQTEKAL